MPLEAARMSYLEPPLVPADHYKIALDILNEKTRPDAVGRREVATGVVDALGLLQVMVLGTANRLLAEFGAPGYAKALSKDETTKLERSLGEWVGTVAAT